jgi:zinc transport system ATP-binding protein
MSEAVVEVDDVWVRFGGHDVLEAVDLTVHEDDFIAVIGPNGGGKTTLLRVILGLIAPAKGGVRLWGEPPAKRRDAIGYVPQHARVDPTFPITVERVVMMGRLYRKGAVTRLGTCDRDAVAGALDAVGLARLAKRHAGRLSGGEIQRVLIARALCVEPKLLLLDEPTANVDASAADEIYSVLTRLNQSIPILLVSHDLAAVSHHVKSIGCLNRRLHYHNSREITPDMVAATYGCPIDLIAHGVPHRVLGEHDRGEGADREDD